MAASGAAAPHRRTLLLAVATLSLLAALVLVTSVVKAPAAVVLEETGVENEEPMNHHEAEQAGLGDDNEDEDEEEDIDEEMTSEAEPEEDEDEEPEEEEVPEEEDMEKEDVEPEEAEEREHHHIFAKLAHYASLHPVFKRCMAKAQMHAFSHEIMKSCGNIHELDTCAYPCWRAMTMYSDKVGCCWETVMEGYRHLDWYAYHAWRHWQGTLSGKCGITFEQDHCGESVGEKPWNDLKDEVKHLTEQADENSHAITEIKYPHNYFHDGYYYYGDNVYDKDWGPTHWKQQAKQQHAVKRSKRAALAEEKEEGAEGEPMGDEVFDMPIGGGEDMGDVHVPSDKLRPYMFVTKRQPAAAAGEAPKEEYEDDDSHRMGKVHMRQVSRHQQLSSGDAYDTYRNYQNELRLREAYDKIHQDPSSAGRFFQPPGEAWHSFPADSDSRPQSLQQRFDLAHGVVEEDRATAKLRKAGVNV